MDVKQFSGDKILFHLERVEEFLSTGKSRPITIEFDMTNLCNHNCPFCYGYYNRKENKSHLSKEEAIRYITQLKAAGVIAVMFSGGGDPLMNRNTIDVMEYAKSLDLDVALITNGLAMDAKTSERAIKICTWIRVSVDADNEETYHKTHGVSKQAWETMLTNVRELVSLKKNTGSSCTIGVGYLTTKDTISREKMLKFTRKFKELGVDYSQFRPLMPKWEENKQVDPDPSLDIIKECVKEAAPGYDVLYSKPKYEFMDKPRAEWRPYGICLGVNFTTVISADSKVYVCCHHRGIEKYCLGDLRKETFGQIWERRQKTFTKIDFRDCPYFCRNNPFNMLLWEMKNGKKFSRKGKAVHENFL
ncbi:MAG: radical SAM protein [Nanoarchaeota archaeon]|nr:radical SAM protein [Nanoarchaeota archaeon]